MADDPFANMNWRRKLNFRLRQGLTLCQRPFAPSRIQPNRDGPPNLLVLAVDTLRYDRLGLAGYPRPVTPFLDGMMSQCTCFTDVMATAPWTLSSFASSLTGLMPTVHGATLTGPVRNMDEQPPHRLRSHVPTLASHLSQLGYRTAAFYANPFFAFGLAETFGYHSYQNLPAGDLTWLALDWIRRHSDQPFFCFVLLNDPHEPTIPPPVTWQPRAEEITAAGFRPTKRQLQAMTRWGEGIDASFALGRVTPPLSVRSEEALALKLALYDACVTYVDMTIGQVHEQLSRWGLMDTTLMTVYADHGEEFLDHLREAVHWNFDPRDIHAIGHGHSHFQELLHVPWLALGPQVPRGTQVTKPVSLCDVAPTLTDWLGVEPLPRPEGLPATLVGQSQAGEMDLLFSAGGETRLVVAEDIAYGPDLVAVRQGKWKLIATRQGNPLALYDLASDPLEKVDSRQAQPEVVLRLTEALVNWDRAAAGFGNSDGPSQGWQEISSEVRRRLQELGYTE